MFCIVHGPTLSSPFGLRDVVIRASFAFSQVLLVAIDKTSTREGVEDGVHGVHSNGTYVKVEGLDMAREDRKVWWMVKS